MRIPSALILRRPPSALVVVGRRFPIIGRTFSSFKTRACPWVMCRFLYRNWWVRGRVIAPRATTITLILNACQCHSHVNNYFSIKVFTSRLRVKEKGYCHNYVCKKKLNSFKPITLAVFYDCINYKHSEDYCRQFKCAKNQTHLCLKKITDQDKCRCHEHCYLGGRAN